LDNYFEYNFIIKYSLFGINIIIFGCFNFKSKKMILNFQPSNSNNNIMNNSIELSDLSNNQPNMNRDINIVI